MAPTVLIVDDEPGILASLSHVLADGGYRTVCTQSGEEALALYRDHRPDVVFLDIWLPDRDGLETLQALLAIDPTAAVVMMSGHGTTSTAVKALKMGAFDFAEKPLSYVSTLDTVAGAIEYRKSAAEHRGALATRELARTREEVLESLRPAPAPRIVREAASPQRTIREATVIYGLGLHSGSRTGMVLQPLPPDSGIHLQTLPTGTLLPAHVSMVADTDYATTLSRDGQHVRTVEHLLSALHAYGITNLLVKVHGEIPVLDGSALEFCRTLEEVGVEEQGVRRKEAVIDRVHEVGGGEAKGLRVEPFPGLAVSYLLEYPPPVGVQSFEYVLGGAEDYRREVAPARTFGFMRDLKMMNELGLGTGGRLDNCILIGEDNVINTELRFTDELARHKVLDIIGDLYLLGYPLRGKVTARRTGHRDNIALLEAILADG